MIRTCLLLSVLYILSCNEQVENETDFLNLSFEQIDKNGQLQSWIIPTRYDIKLDSLDKTDGKFSIILDPKQHITTDHIYIDSTRNVSIDVSFDYKVKSREDTFYIATFWHNFKKGWDHTVDSIQLKQSNNWLTYKQKTISNKGFIACTISFGYSKSIVGLDNVKILIDGKPYQPTLISNTEKQIIKDSAINLALKKCI